MKTKKIHISRVRAGDTVFHGGKFQTICPANIKRNSFMGDTIWGDSYALGTKLVEVVDYN